MQVWLHLADQVNQHQLRVSPVLIVPYRDCCIFSIQMHAVLSVNDKWLNL